MANHKATLKSIRQTETRTEHNKSIRSRMRTLAKKARASVAEKNETADKDIASYMSSLDKGIKRGIVHPNKAARLKSRIIKAKAKATA